ncbi:MAG: adenosylmethionine decarboxylase [Dehalococcoidia bacterium]
MNVLGTHILLDLKDCDREILNDLSLVRDALISAAQQMGAKILGESFHKFDPQGVTGVLPIAESHLCIHTWPEHGYAAVDVFTCSQSIDAHRIAEHLIGKLKSKDPFIIEVKRGVFTPSQVRIAG